MRVLCLGGLVVVIALLMAGCGQGSLSVSEEPFTGRPTPVVANVKNTPIPVKGSDGQYHVVYEVALFNFADTGATLSQLNVVDARDGTTVASYTAPQIAQRLGVDGTRSSSSSTLGPLQTGIIYLHLIFKSEDAIPPQLNHQIIVKLRGNALSETVALTDVSMPTSLVLGAPLKGENYVAGDGCCDSVRHVRAVLPIHGELFNGQRFAIDWEQLDSEGRIYVGDPKRPSSYVIYGKPVYAVADATVVAAVNRYPDTPPGVLPLGMKIEDADGNHVVLNLGQGRYALYAHLAPGSVMVSPGQQVKKGDMLGRVGTSGNSSEPHLHFQVTDGPKTLASDGVPYKIEHFIATRRGISTRAFDKAAQEGRPLPTELVEGRPQRQHELPLDLLVVDFPS